MQGPGAVFNVRDLSLIFSPYNKHANFESLAHSAIGGPRFRRNVDHTGALHGCVLEGSEVGCERHQRHHFCLRADI